MAYYDVARDRASYDFAIVFRGTFNSSAAVAWSTRPVKTATGLLDGRMIIDGTMGSGLSQSSGGAFRLPSLTIVLENSDDAITKYIVGTTSSSASAEYRGDGMLNLTGVFYHLVRDPVTGATYEQALTPTMCARGSLEYDGFKIAIPMAARQDKVAGRSKFIFAVRDLAKSTDGGFSGGVNYTFDGTTSGYQQVDCDGDMLRIAESLDAHVPYIYSTNAFPLIPLTQFDMGALMLWGVTMAEPDLSRWPTWPIYADTFDTPVGVTGNDNDFIGTRTLKVIQRAVVTPDGATANVWLLMVELHAYVKPSDGLKRATYFMLGDPFLGVAGSLSYPDHFGPAGVIRAMARDHSEVGSSSVDSTSFARASIAIPRSYVGGTFTGDNELAREFEAITRVAGISIFLGKDNKLHAQVNRSFNSDDQATIAAGLPHITHADIIGGWKETVPWDDPEQLGAPVSRLRFDWSDQQKRFWGSRLPATAAGNTSLPMAEIREGTLPGAWIDGRSAVKATIDNAVRRAFVGRRIECICRAWVATMEIGTLFWISHPRGLSNAGTGYFTRVVRLEDCEYVPGEDGARCRFEDLGSIASNKLGKLDTITNWIGTTPAAGRTLTLAAGSPNVVAGAATFAPGDVGKNLWTQGSAFRSNTGSRKITVVGDSTHATVDQDYGHAETLVAAGSGWTAAWSVMETQGSKGSAYRSDRIRQCVEATGLFRDGATAGFQYSND